METSLIDPSIAQAPFASLAPTTASGGANAEATGAERRRSERVAASMPGWVSGESHDRAARGRDITVIDLSMHGIGFRDPKAGYRIGATHWLVVNGGAMRMSTRVRIVSCRKNEAGQFEIGAMFY